MMKLKNQKHQTLIKLGSQDSNPNQWTTTS